MNRDYANQNHNIETKFFVGNEVENTIAKGKKTLFVVGLENPKEIINAATSMKCEAIYFGANHSFNPVDNQEWELWESMIKTTLDDPAGLLCTLDLDVKHVKSFHESGLDEKNNFILMVSVKMPYIKLFGYNTVVKIDDIDFEKTNPGVWCHNLSDLMSQASFTHWSKYKDDKTI